MFSCNGWRDIEFNYQVILTVFCKERVTVDALKAKFQALEELVKSQPDLFPGGIAFFFKAEKGVFNL
jgi:hypothetical protein